MQSTQQPKVHALGGVRVATFVNTTKDGKSKYYSTSVVQRRYDADKDDFVNITSYSPRELATLKEVIAHAIAWQLENPLNGRDSDAATDVSTTENAAEAVAVE